MNKIKFLKKNEIELNGVTYRPYTICNIPTNFGFIYDEETDKEGISQWFNYKGFTYIMKK
jgi:hypothetical protein